MILRKSYRKLARQYHPDVNKAADAEDEVQRSKEAYDVLSDDRNARPMTSSDMLIRIKAWAAAAADFGGGFGDIFDMFFGGGGGGSRDPNAPQRGNDLQYTMTIEFKEAVFGKETDITIPRTETLRYLSWFTVRSRERSRKLVRYVMAADNRKLFRIRRLAVLSTVVLVRIAAAQAALSKKNAEPVMAQVK